MTLANSQLSGLLLALERQVAGRTAASLRNTEDMLAADFREFGRSGKVWARNATISAMAEETNRSSLWRLDADQQWRMVFHQGTATS